MENISDQLVIIIILAMRHPLPLSRTAWNIVQLVGVRAVVEKTYNMMVDNFRVTYYYIMWFFFYWNKFTIYTYSIYDMNRFDKWQIKVDNINRKISKDTQW